MTSNYAGLEIRAERIYSDRRIFAQSRRTRLLGVSLPYSILESYMTRLRVLRLRMIALVRMRIAYLPILAIDALRRAEVYAIRIYSQVIIVKEVMRMIIVDCPLTSAMARNCSNDVMMINIPMRMMVRYAHPRRARVRALPERSRISARIM